MSKVLRGVVHGKTIEVTEDLGMSDGQVVELVVTAADALPPSGDVIRPRGSPRKLPGPPPGWQPGSTETAAGMMAACWTEEDDRILEEIHRQRRIETRREIPE